MKTKVAPTPYKYLFAFWLCLAAILGMFLTYSYFLNHAVLNAVSLEKAEARKIALNANIGELDSRYIVKKNKIDREYASKLGFKEATDTKFISRKSLGKALTLNNEI